MRLRLRILLAMFFGIVALYLLVDQIYIENSGKWIIKKANISSLTDETIPKELESSFDPFLNIFNAIDNSSVTLGGKFNLLGIKSKFLFNFIFKSNNSL